MFLLKEPSFPVAMVMSPPVVQSLSHIWIFNKSRCPVSLHIIFCHLSVYLSSPTFPFLLPFPIPSLPIYLSPLLPTNSPTVSFFLPLSSFSFSHSPVSTSVSSCFTVFFSFSSFSSYVYSFFFLSSAPSFSFLTLSFYHLLYPFPLLTFILPEKYFYLLFPFSNFPFLSFLTRLYILLFPTHIPSSSISHSSVLSSVSVANKLCFILQLKGHWHTRGKETSVVTKQCRCVCVCMCVCLFLTLYVSPSICFSLHFSSQFVMFPTKISTWV